MNVPVGSTAIATMSEAQRQLVIFTLGEEAYGVDIHQVREIIRELQITTIPRTPHFVEGVINLRGGVIPVLNLGRRFGRDAEDESSDEARIVIVELGEQLVGMRVDGVSEVLRIAAEQVAPPSPFIAGGDSAFVTGIVRVDERLVILLDLNQVLLQEEKEQLKLAVDTFVEGASD